MSTSKLPQFQQLIASGSLSNRQYSILHNLEMLVYPLRADMATLRRFVDSYLNFFDDVRRPPFYFQPAMPCVLLLLMHYPWLSVPTQNLTAFEQHELSFTIPLECYAVEDGVLVFKQFALCTPFLYLDRSLSILAGRDLFGLPKIALKFAPVHPPDVPTAPAQQVALKLRVPSLKGDTYIPFIEIFRDPRPFSSGRHFPADSLTAVPKAIQSYFSVAAEQWYSLLRFPIGGYEQARDTQSLLSMTRQLSDLISNQLPLFPLYRLAPKPYSSTADVHLASTYMDLISLKQVRDAEETDLVAFQSVVRSTMYLDRLGDFGWLCGPFGEDPTTDINIHIHSVVDQPVIQSLGLEVYSQQGAADQQISVLKPRFPYWVKLDLVYGLGSNLYWRGKTNWWSTSEEPDPSTGFKNRYCTFGGGAQQENPLFVVSPQGRVHVATLPLTADGKQRLRDLGSRYLANERYDFQVCNCGMDGPFVWLITRRINDSGVGRAPASEQEVLLGTFVEWNLKGHAEPLGHGFLPLYAITDSQSRVLSHTEIFGRPIVLGKFENLGPVWPGLEEGAGESVVMAVKSSILPVLYSGAAPEHRELIRIAAQRTRRPGRDRNIQYPRGIVLVSLQQIIDCRLPERDSHQAIVVQLMKVDTCDFHEVFGYSLNVTFSRYESLPLVRQLGLEVKPGGVRAGQDATIDIVEARRHAWFDTLVEENGSINFAWRIGASDWQYPEMPEDWLYKLEQLDSNIPLYMNQMRQFIIEFSS
jgi:hypothetical protein